MGEASAINALANLGALVSVPLFHSPDYDLLADFGDRPLRVQVKTSTRSKGAGFAVQVATSGGNQSWTGLVKRFDPARCDLLFVLVADGRRWLIPAAEVQGTRTIVVGCSPYGEFELRDDRESSPSADRPRIAAGRGSAGAGEPGWTVNSVPQAEWVRIPPPPLHSPSPTPETGRTRLSANHQLTIPLAPFRAAGLEVGDEIKVEASGPGRVQLTRAGELAGDYAASLFGEKP